LLTFQLNAPVFIRAKVDKISVASQLAVA